MSTPFLGEIRLFAGNFAPRGWATCDGQLLSIAANTALFSLLGTTYGGDGMTTFALPNLSGRVPVHRGQGGGLTNRNVGDSGGAPTVTLTLAQLAAHSHAANASSAPGTSSSPTNNVWATTAPNRPVYAGLNHPAAMAGQSSSAGGGAPHNNLQPYLPVTFLIALTGIFPSRS
jgi:microcystin-dependent protein